MSFDHVEVVRKAVQTKMSIEKCYNPENTGFGIFDGVVGTAFSLLAKTKKERFTIKKPTNKITDADIMEHLQKGLPSITRRDFTKFRKSVKGLKTSIDYTDDAKGFARYLDTIIWEVGYLGLSIIIFNNNNPQANPIDIAKHNHDFALDIFNYCTELAEIIYPSGKEYGKTLQGVMLNKLAQTGRRTAVKKRDAFFYEDDTMKLVFPNASKYGGVAMTTPTQKVLSMYHEELCKALPDPSLLYKTSFQDLNKYSTQRITVSHYMDLTHTKDEKTARKTIREACTRLTEVLYRVRTKENGELVEREGHLFQSNVKYLRGGTFEMEFSNKFLEYCANTNPAAFHYGMYQINGKTNPYSWSIGEKLRWYYEINRGREQAARLSVSKLLEAVTDIPTYEEVMQTNRRVTERIISPMERDIDELQRLGVLKSWEYSNAKGLPLTKEQVENMDYDTWSKLYIAFELNLPPQDHYIKQRGKRIAKAKERAAKKKAEAPNGNVARNR